MDIQNINDVDFKCELTHEEYKAILSNLKPGEFKAFGDVTTISDFRYIGMQREGKIYLMHFFEQGDAYADPPYENFEHTYYMTADIPKELQQMPKPVVQIKLNSREDVQTFFTNLGKYNRGELKLDDSQN